MTEPICQELQAHGTRMTMPLHGLNFKLTRISDCNRSWDFGPLQKASPLLPAWAIDGHLITGFELGPEHPVQNIQVSAGDATELLKGLYPRLSWPEILRFINRPETEKYFEISHLMRAYGCNWDDHWQRVSEFLVQWPLEIQSFVAEKELRPFDMMVLLNLSPSMQIPLLKKIISLQPSKSVFCQILELAGENLLLGSSLEMIEETLNKPDALDALKKTRFPMTFFKDQSFKDKARHWTWPKGVQAQCLRKGDSLGMEFRFFAKNPDELQKILRSFESSSSQWKISENESN